MGALFINKIRQSVAVAVQGERRSRACSATQDLQALAARARLADGAMNINSAQRGVYKQNTASPIDVNDDCRLFSSLVLHPWVWRAASASGSGGAGARATARGRQQCQLALITIT